MNQTLFFYLKLATIVIVILGYSAYRLYKHFTTNTTENLENVIPMCPDYWTTVKKNVCKNVYNLGLGDDPKGEDIMDFNQEPFNDPNPTIGQFYKCTWACSRNVSWEHIDKLCGCA